MRHRIILSQIPTTSCSAGHWPNSLASGIMEREPQPELLRNKSSSSSWQPVPRPAMRKHPDLVVQVALSLGSRSGILLGGQFLLYSPLTHLAQKQEPRSLLVRSIQVGDAPVTAFASSWKGDLASCILPESHQSLWQRWHRSWSLFYSTVRPL